MTDELTIVHVAENVLVEFIEQVARGRATNIHVSKGDTGWTVTYKSPFTRDIKADAAEEKHFPLKVGTDRTPINYEFCKNCSGLEGCLHRAADKQWCPCQTLDAILADKAQDIGG